jgi:hypothetical protein
VLSMGRVAVSVQAVVEKSINEVLKDM